MKKLSAMERGPVLYFGFQPHEGYSLLLLKLPFENYRDDPRLRNYVDDEQEFKVVVSNESKFVLFREAIAWIDETVEGPWSVRAEGSSPTIFQFSFSDLQIATLFRLRF